MPVESQRQNWAIPGAEPRASASNDQAMKKAIADLFTREVDERVLEHRRQLDFEIEAFKQRQETLIASLPRAVRSMTMREFMTRYSGDMKAAIAGQGGWGAGQGSGAAGGRGGSRVAELIAQAQVQKDEWVRKRKRVEDELDAMRATKRSPQKAILREGTPLKTHTDRFLSPSPSKKRLGPTPPRTPAPTTATRLQTTTPSRVRPPAIATFSPSLALPPKTPKYPGARSFASPTRSAAASPTRQAASSARRSPLKRVKGPIIVHKLQTQSSSTNLALPVAPAASLTPDTPSLFVPSAGPSPASSRLSPAPAGHSNLAPSPSAAPTSQASPMPLTPSRSRSLLMKIPTIDGHVLELDPLMNSPGDLDALTGISSRAKQEARQEMGRLVSDAMRKWRVG
ncbi:hypothetical protein HDZ31DRAFT_80555 [Schizophyllum fasciatum]